MYAQVPQEYYTSSYLSPQHTAPHPVVKLLFVGSKNADYSFVTPAQQVLARQTAE